MQVEVGKNEKQDGVGGVSDSIDRAERVVGVSMPDVLTVVGRRELSRWREVASDLSLAFHQWRYPKTNRYLHLSLLSVNVQQGPSKLAKAIIDTVAGRKRARKSKCLKVGGYDGPEWE